MGRKFKRRRREVGPSRAGGDEAVRDRIRSLGERTHSPGTLASRLMVMAAAHRLFRLPRPRPGAVGSLRESLRPAALQTVRRQSPRTSQLFLLLLARVERTHCRAGARRREHGLSGFLPESGFEYRG